MVISFRRTELSGRTDELCMLIMKRKLRNEKKKRGVESSLDGAACNISSFTSLVTLFRPHGLCCNE